MDKTAYLPTLLNKGKYLFIARPKLFGKSLFINTLKELFLGNRPLFEHLWIAERWAWEPHSVIVLDFNRLDYRQQDLDGALLDHLRQTALDAGLALRATSAKNALAELLEGLARQTGKKTVVLVDEYDKPLTDFLMDPLRLEANRQTLKNFYSILKSADSDLHFALLTGVSKFGKVSIFSDLNNLLDLTLDESLAALFGYTQAEVEHYFAPQLAQVAQKLGWPLARVRQVVQRWYNGYSWDGEQTLYNPFSLLSFLQTGELGNFWFETGTPTLLTNLLKNGQLPPFQLEKLEADEQVFSASELPRLDVVSLLLQTGYLTVKARTRTEFGRQYTLGYPNYEVKESFLKYLLADYTETTVGLVEVNIANRVRQAFQQNDLPGFFQLLDTVLASVPYQIFKTEEAYFHSLTHVVLQLSGVVVFSEVATRHGRMDLALETSRFVYVLEFKVRGTAAEALAQIEALGYADRFRATGKTLRLVGVVFDPATKAIAEWQVVDKG